TILFHSTTSPPPPKSTLFPYTTLFRSGKKSNALATTGATTIPNSTRKRIYVNPLYNAKNKTRISPRFQRRFRSSAASNRPRIRRSEEHTSELQSRENLVCRLLLEKKKK